MSGHLLAPRGLGDRRRQTRRERTVAAFVGQHGRPRDDHLLLRSSLGCLSDHGTEHRRWGREFRHRASFLSLGSVTHSRQERSADRIGLRAGCDQRPRDAEIVRLRSIHQVVHPWIAVRRVVFHGFSRHGLAARAVEALQLPVRRIFRRRVTPQPVHSGRVQSDLAFQGAA